MYVRNWLEFNSGFLFVFFFLLFCIYSWQSNCGFFKMTNRCYNEYLTLGSNVHQWMHFYHIIDICSLHHEMETIFNFNFIIWLWSKIVSRYWGMVGLLTVRSTSRLPQLYVTLWTYHRLLIKIYLFKKEEYAPLSSNCKHVSANLQWFRVKVEIFMIDQNCIISI